MIGELLNAGFVVFKYVAGFFLVLLIIAFVLGLIADMIEGISNMIEKSSKKKNGSS